MIAKQQISLESSIHRLAQHLDTLASQLSIIEEILCKTLPEESNKTSFDVQKIQGLDYIRQSLEDCALLSLLMSGNIAGCDFHAEKIASRLKLESTRAIVLPVGPKNLSVNGDVQLF